MWMCPECGEELEDQFKECWKCFSPEKPSNMVIDISPSENIENLEVKDPLKPRGDMSSQTNTSNKNETTKFRIFLSYSSVQASLAEQVYMTLTTSGHKVFFDRTNLPPGEEFDRAILDEIRSADIFIFLISPESIADGTYTRTELRFARDTWPDPTRKILPVLSVMVDFATIQNYLKAVTILRPEGNLPAEVSAAVNYLATGTNSKETVAAQVELIKDNAQLINQLHHKQEIEEIDKKWEEEKKRFIVTVNEKEMTPSRKLAFSSGLSFSAFSLFGLLFFTIPDPDFFGWWPAVIPLVMALFAYVHIKNKAVKYEKAEADYYKHRETVLSKKVDDT